MSLSIRYHRNNQRRNYSGDEGEAVYGFDLIWYFMEDAEYGEEASVDIINLGSARLYDEDGTWRVFTAYTFAPRKSDSIYYTDQSATRELGTCSSLEDAKLLLFNYTTRKLLELAETMSQLK